MQNTVYERKQNGEDFFSLLIVTYFRFGNCPTNVLVTEQPQYYVAVCIFSTWQNTEISLISNDLRLIFTSPLFHAQPITFHSARHTWATVGRYCHIPIEVISEGLGHASVTTTEGYMKGFGNSRMDRANKVIMNYIFKGRSNTVYEW